MTPMESKKIPVEFPDASTAPQPDPTTGAPEAHAAGSGLVQTPDAASPTGAEAAPASEAALREHLARLQAERDDLFQTLIRRQADFENYRKRIERERSEDAERVAARIVTDLLPVLDAVERALAALPNDGEGPGVEYRRGFELIYQQLHHLLERYKVTRIPAVGLQFDPHVHQAIERVETDQHPEGTVLEELQAGYTLRDRVLRPSVVRVAALPPAAAETKAQ